MNDNRFKQKSYYQSRLPGVFLDIVANDIGYFGINTYMYGFVNNVFLGGVPNTSAMFDGAHGCVYDFIEHDMGHTVDIVTVYTVKNHLGQFDNKRFNDNGNMIKHVYDMIMNDNLSQQDTELLVIGLFAIVHEVSAREGNSINIFNPKFFKSGELLKKHMINVMDNIDAPFELSGYYASPSPFTDIRQVVTYLGNYLLDKYGYAASGTPLIEIKEYN